MLFYDRRLAQTHTRSSLRFQIRWIITICIFLISAIAYLDRVNISIAGRTIATTFRLNNVELGWVFSAFVLGYAIFQAPAGRLADKAGPRAILAAGVLWWALFSVLVTIIPNAGGWSLLLLIAVRFGLGAGEAVLYPASNCAVARWIPPAERGLANGIIFSGVGFGAGITPPLITTVMLHFGWRAAFWCCAAIGLAAGLVWYLVARDWPREHPWLRADERSLIEETVPLARSSSSETPLSWKRILTEPNILCVTFSYFAYGYAAYIFFSWFFIYLSGVRGLNLRESAYYSMLPFLAMAAGSPLGGLLSDRWTRRRSKYAGRCVVAAIGMAFAAIFIALGTQVASPRFASVVLAAGAGSLYVSQSSFWSVSAAIGKRSAGAVSGFMNMGGQIGGALTASLSPVIANHLGWGWSFLVSAILCASGALVWLRVDPDPVAVEPPPVSKAAQRV